jgi:hypothetical protein
MSDTVRCELCTGTAATPDQIQHDDTLHRAVAEQHLEADPVAQQIRADLMRLQLP